MSTRQAGIVACLGFMGLGSVVPALAANVVPRTSEVLIEAQVMVRAFPAGGVAASDVANVQVQQAREVVTKSLGDDARDLVFVAVSPCTVWDTRFASGAPFAGAIADGVTRRFYSHLDAAGSDFTAYGGNPSCTEANQTSLGGPPYAVMMTVYVNNPVGNGWLTFYRDGDPDPSTFTISVYYSPGPTRTQTVISKSSRGYGAGTYDVAVTGRFSTADASASVVGYFMKPVNINLPNSTATTGNILKGTSSFIHNYGTENTFTGRNAGNFTMTGRNNTATGALALSSNTSGAYNSATGSGALSANTTGLQNTASGDAALGANTTGSGNTGTGASALFQNTSGGYNTAIGYLAAVGNNTGSYNTAVGQGALYYNIEGAQNVAIGYAALFGARGSYNIGIGGNQRGGQHVTTGSYNIAIGNGGVMEESGAIRIGTTGEQSKAFIAGIRGVTTTSNDAVAVLIDGNGQLGTVSSSRRMKDDIADMDDASSALMRLRPVTFHYKSDQAPEGRRLQYGLIAEEVAEIYPGLVARSPDGEAETVMYQFLAPMLLNEYQKQRRKIDAQDRLLARQAQRIAELERKWGEQGARGNALERQAAEIAGLKRQVATLLEQYRVGAATAGLQFREPDLAAMAPFESGRGRSSGLE